MNNKNLLAFNLIIATAILVTAAIIFSTGLAFFGYREFWKDSEVSSDQSAIPAAPLPSNTTTVIPAAQPPTSSETAVTFGSVTLVIPPSVASGASGSEVPRRDSDDAAGWQKTPGHTQIMLGDYYVLEGKFHQPQIYIYPSQEYAELVPATFEGIRRVNNIIYGPSAAICVDQLDAMIQSLRVGP